MMRISRHPIFDIPERDDIQITFNGKSIKAKNGEMIAAALLANGINVFRTTKRFHEPRGLFCGIGQCNDCVMVVDGVANVRTCITPVKEGMTISTQHGLGRL